MHLSIQSHAHAHAEVLVKAWGKQAGVQIAAVRYHILRNGLILKNIHIERDDDNINIEHMLIRTNPALLNQPTVHIGSVELSGLNGELHLSKTAPFNSNPTWQNDPELMKLWLATSSLQVQRGQFKLYIQQHDSPPPTLSGKTPERQPTDNKQPPTPLIINTISMQLSTQAKQRTLVASAHLYEGSLQWQQTSDEQNKTSKGQFSWQHINTLALTKALALKPISGHLQGKLTWQQIQMEPRQQNNFNIQVDMQFNATENIQHEIASASPQELPLTQQLQLTAAQQNNTWEINLHASAWPLAPWSDLIPGIGQQRLIAAQLNGSSHWQSSREGWNINGDKGGLQHAVFGATQHDDNIESKWSWHDIHYDSFHIDTTQHHVHLSQVKLNNGNFTMNTALSVPKTTAQSKEMKIWNISADHIQADHMTLNLILPDGTLTLQALQAQATWPAKTDLKFKINTKATHELLTPQWQLRGIITRSTASKKSNADFTIRAKRAPLTHLRLLLPLQGDRNSPVGLAGMINLRGNINVREGMWRMQGKATAYDVQFSHAGGNWIAKEISAEFGPVGMGLAYQNISQINAAHWSYVAALEPLQPIQTNRSEQSPLPYQTAWWVSALSNKNVQIQHLNLNNGNLSIGHDDSIWATNINIQLNDVLAGKWADINIKADVSDGKFMLQGEWDALANPQRFRGSASLDGATPFFLHEWMMASGMPRLMRGRLNAHVNVEHESSTDSYQSEWTFQLRHGMTETGLFNNDPMLTRSGLNTEYLLHRLSQTNINKTITLQGQVNNLWQQRPLSFNRIGASLQASMRQAAESASGNKPTAASSSASVAAHIRLHERKPLSLNERSRLFKIVRQLRKQPNITVDLKPQWSGDELNADLLTRIQHTQALIERFLHHRKINQQRIFPRWPGAADHDNEISSIQIILNP